MQPEPEQPGAPSNPSDRAALALAAAAQALAAAIQALQGNLPGAPIPALSLAPAQAIPAAAPAQVRQPGSFSVITLIELVNEFLKSKARAGRSDRYLRTLRVSLGSFTKARARMLVADITPADIERWLTAQEWAKKTASNYLGDVQTLLNYAVNRGYIASNPAKGAEVIFSGAAEERPTEIHTPEQVALVLETARKIDLDIMRHLAVRYFAGIRSAEAHRLRESDIKLEQGLIEVPALKAKTRSRRLVTIEPALKAWLELGGELRAIDHNAITDAVRKSGVTWPHNVARHSFVSYHLAQNSSASKTALEAGTGEQNVFRNYRALVTPKQAAAFWALRPK